MVGVDTHAFFTLIFDIFSNTNNLIFNGYKRSFDQQSTCVLPIYGKLFTNMCLCHLQKT